MAESVKKVTRGSETGKEIHAARPAHALSPIQEMDRLFEGFFPRGWMRPFRGEWPSWSEAAAPFEARMPKVDVIDRDNEVVVRAVVPGIAKKDLDVSVSDDTVTIKGETKHEEKEEKGDYYRCETSHGAFSRTVALPHYVNADGAKAQFKDGILELTLPKVEKAKRRSIRVE